jgi:hypothetical protein
MSLSAVLDICLLIALSIPPSIPPFSASPNPPYLFLIAGDLKFSPSMLKSSSVDAFLNTTRLPLIFPSISEAQKESNFQQWMNFLFGGRRGK